MKKKILAALTAGLIALGSFGIGDAATRDEIAAIQVKSAKNFKCWTKDSAAKQKLVDYVKDVTNKSSKNFIPVEDRIAVFDMDGKPRRATSNGCCIWNAPCMIRITRRPPKTELMPKWSTRKLKPVTS